MTRIISVLNTYNTHRTLFPWLGKWMGEKIDLIKSNHFWTMCANQLFILHHLVSIGSTNFFLNLMRGAVDAAWYCSRFAHSIAMFPLNIMVLLDIETLYFKGLTSCVFAFLSKSWSKNGTLISCSILLIEGPA